MTLILILRIYLICCENTKPNKKELIKIVIRMGHINFTLAYFRDKYSNQ